MRLFCLTIVLLLLPLPAIAKGKHDLSDWNSVASLPTGTMVGIEGINHSTTLCTMEWTDDKAIACTTISPDVIRRVAVPRSEISKVWIYEKKRDGVPLSFYLKSCGIGFIGVVGFMNVDGGYPGNHAIAYGAAAAGGTAAIVKLASLADRHTHLVSRTIYEVPVAATSQPVVR